MSTPIGRQRYAQLSADQKQRDRLASMARGRAMEKLAKNHPSEFLILHNKERALLELFPVGMVARGRRPRVDQ